MPEVPFLRPSHCFCCCEAASEADLFVILIRCLPVSSHLLLLTAALMCWAHLAGLLTAVVVDSNGHLGSAADRPCWLTHRQAVDWRG